MSFLITVVAAIAVLISIFFVGLIVTWLIEQFFDISK
jgi:hypothetical protein